jgi:Uma2 family endonuclease
MTTTTAIRWTSGDLELLPDDGKRYEIIDGDLYMSKQPHWHHQTTCFHVARVLREWNITTGAGRINIAPGVIFAEDDDVAPDVVWISRQRFENSLGAEGHLHATPELVVEVLSPGWKNERRDREAKLKLYSRRGVEEYWLVDWRAHKVEVYRRKRRMLRLVESLYQNDKLQTPVLPGFECVVAEFFEDVLPNSP